MKIVITGALGHIGSKVIREIPSAFPGAEVVMIDNMLTQRYASLFDLPENAKYKFIENDVTQMDLEPIIKEANIVLNLAAITDAAGSFGKRDVVENNNFNTTQKVADVCAVENVPLIHLSSTSVYGTQADIVDENCSLEELQPQSPYAETKLKEEAYLKELSQSRGLKFIVCRFGTICGTSQGMRFHTAVNKFCWQAVMGQPITVWKTALHQKRPYLALEDAVRAVCFIIKNKIFDNEIYNVLTDNLTVNDIISNISKHIPNIKVEFVETEIMNQLSYEVLSERFKAKGFHFEGSIAKNIKNTIELLKGANSIAE